MMPTEREQPIPSQPTAAVPNPDPTLRTMELVDRAITTLKGEYQIRFDAVVTRFDAMDKAVALLHDDSVRVPTQMDKAIAGLRELIESRIETVMTIIEEKVAAGVDIMNEREKRYSQRADDSQRAIEAALSSASQVTAKIEAGFGKQMDTWVQTVQLSQTNTDGKIADLKDRLTALESRGAVNDPATLIALRGMTTKLEALGDASVRVVAKEAGGANVWAIVVAVIGLVVPIIGVVAYFIGRAAP